MAIGNLRAVAATIAIPMMGITSPPTLADFYPSLDELADLPAEWEAERSSRESPWIRTMSKLSDQI
jgi:hypothetical protein